MLYFCKLRKRRRERGMTEELDEKSNRSARNIGDIELGKIEPLLGTALLLCKACEIDVGELKDYVPEDDFSYV